MPPANLLAGDSCARAAARRPLAPALPCHPVPSGGRDYPVGRVSRNLSTYLGRGQAVQQQRNRRALSRLRLSGQNSKRAPRQRHTPKRDRPRAQSRGEILVFPSGLPTSPLLNVPVPARISSGGRATLYQARRRSAAHSGFQIKPLLLVASETSQHSSLGAAARLPACVNLRVGGRSLLHAELGIFLA